MAKRADEIKWPNCSPFLVTSTSSDLADIKRAERGARVIFGCLGA
jgi:hypothetical protein